MNALDYRRRKTVEVKVGDVLMGGDRPVRLQSMTSTSTMDTEGSAAQASRIAAAGGEIVRLTAQGSREAENIGRIRSLLRERGCNVPLVADIHFNPKAAMTAAVNADKVRINPGNFIDPGRTFVKLEFTDSEYAAELRRLEDTLVPLLDLCRANGTALRIGVNHGSLSDRIMSRYGDTPAGMAESAMEFLRVCRKHNFNDVVISIKASNVSVMIETVRLLVAVMDAEDMHYPLHLGVTEAGDGEDGRIKSAVGIGTLLAEGIGDTIRVSLSEEPEAEIPVALAIASYAAAREADKISSTAVLQPFEPFAGVPLVAVDRTGDFEPDSTPDMILTPSGKGVQRIEPGVPLPPVSKDAVLLLEGSRPSDPERMKLTISELRANGYTNTIITAMRYDDNLTAADVALRAAADLGRLVYDGFGNGIMVLSPSLSPGESARLAFSILQSTRRRITRTEYISCPGCGRTLYDLQSTLKRIKEATAGLKRLKIGVMGCIVNGPGEMADADYGYVGAGPGRVSLYKGKECVERNIPAEEAVGHLVELIKRNGDWHE